MSLAVHITAPDTYVYTPEIYILLVFSVDVANPDGLTKLDEGSEGLISIDDDGRVLLE